MFSVGSSCYIIYFHSKLARVSLFDFCDHEIVTWILRRKLSISKDIAFVSNVLVVQMHSPTGSVSPNALQCLESMWKCTEPFVEI